MDILEDGFQVVDLSNGTEITTLDDETPNITQDGKHELAKNKSVDVFNALNLYNEELGVLYESEGYNPFEEDFKLTADFINEVLEDKKQQGELSSEEFLENNNKTIAKNFAKAFIKNKELINKIKQELENTTDDKVKAKMNKMLITLKNRGEMLRLSIQKLKQKDANAIKMYKDLFGLDSELSEILKDEFNEKVNTNNMIVRMIELCNTRANQKTKNPKLKSTSNIMSTSIENSATHAQIAEPQQEQENIQGHQIDNLSLGNRHPRPMHHKHRHEHEHDHEHGHRPPPRPPKTQTNDKNGPEINI